MQTFILIDILKSWLKKTKELQEAGNTDATEIIKEIQDTFCIELEFIDDDDEDE